MPSVLIAFALLTDLCGGDGAEGGKLLTQLVVSDVVAQVLDVQVHALGTATAGADKSSSSSSSSGSNRGTQPHSHVCHVGHELTSTARIHLEM